MDTPIDVVFGRDQIRQLVDIHAPGTPAPSHAVVQVPYHLNHAFVDAALQGLSPASATESLVGVDIANQNATEYGLHLEPLLNAMDSGLHLRQQDTEIRACQLG